MRVIGLDLSRTFAQIAYLEESEVRSGGRVGLLRHSLDKFAQGLSPTDEVVLEATTIKGIRLIISDACRGLVEAAAEVYPGTDWQRCMLHFYRNVFSHVPNGKVAEVARMLKAIHAQEGVASVLRTDFWVG